MGADYEFGSSGEKKVPGKVKASYSALPVRGKSVSGPCIHE